MESVRSIGKFKYNSIESEDKNPRNIHRRFFKRY